MRVFTDIAHFKGWLREVMALASHVRMLSDEPELLKRGEPTLCDTEAMNRKVANAQDTGVGIVEGLKRDIVVSYRSARHTCNRRLGEVSWCLKKAFNCEAQNLQQDIYNDICGTETEPGARSRMCPAQFTRA